MNKFKEFFWVLFKSKELTQYRIAFIAFFIIGWVMGLMILGFSMHNIYIVLTAWTPMFGAAFYLIYLIGKAFIDDFKRAWTTRYYTNESIKNEYRKSLIKKI